MNIAFYLENQNISSVDLRYPEAGNPGVGGTEFNFITLAKELTQQYQFLHIKIFAQDTRLLPEQIRCQRALNCVEAAELAIEQGVEFFVWRPTVREDASRLLEIINDLPIKFIIWAHNTPKESVITRLATASNVRRFVPVGEFQKRAISEGIIDSKTTLIHNGFHSEAYSGAVEKDSNLVVYTGSLIPVKGFGLLAKAWPKVLQRCPSAKLVVIGSGQLYNRNANLGPWGIADADFENKDIIPYLSDDGGRPIPSVVFKGVMGVEKIPVLKRAICGVVNPIGRGENCPGSAIEFLSAGTAVVSAAAEGILDVVDDGVTGLLGSGVQELVDNILLMLMHPDYAKKLGANGPDSIQRRFNYANICDLWMSLFAEEQSFPLNNDRYFLPLSKNKLAHDVAIRRAMKKLPQSEQFNLYAHVTELSEGRYPLTIVEHKDKWEVKANNRRFEFPLGIPSVKLLMCSFSYDLWLYRKYTLPGFIELDGSDIVLDCGSFVGGFAYAAANQGCKVICIEPDIRNCEFIKRNLSGFSQVSVECVGLYDLDGQMAMNVVDNPVEHSFLSPDSGNLIDVKLTPVLTIDSLSAKYDVDTIHFAKIEAEGVELEILKGMRTTRVEKLAIDCSPERDGKSSVNEIRELLIAKGYQSVTRGWMLFAKLMM